MTRNFAKALRGALLGAMLVGGVLGSFGCTQPTIVNSAFGRGWNIERGLGQTFEWVPEAVKSTSRNYAKNPTIDQFLREKVQQRLEAKGYRQQASGQPAFWVDYHVITERKPDWMQSGPVLEYTQGSIFLDLIDSQSRAVVWRASAQSRFDEGVSPEEARKRIEQGVRLMLDKLPNYKAAGA